MPGPKADAEQLRYKWQGRLNATSPANDSAPWQNIKVRGKMSWVTYANFMIVKIREREESADVNESCRVEEQIDHVRKDGIFGLTIEITTIILAQNLLRKHM